MTGPLKRARTSNGRAEHRVASQATVLPLLVSARTADHIAISRPEFFRSHPQTELGYAFFAVFDRLFVLDPSIEPDWLHLIVDTVLLTTLMSHGMLLLGAL
jgi:hypothetical protein